MYLPPQFKSEDLAQALKIMGDYPFANVISNDVDDLPYVSHLPLVAEQRDDGLCLLGHFAKPNPQVQFLKANAKLLAVFNGAHAYMSPSVYPDTMRVPTWSYLAVHAYGEVAWVDDADTEQKDVILKKLIARMEPSYAAQWRGLGESFQHKLLSGIAAFEMPVSNLECKIKLNQHRPESHAAMFLQYQNGNDNERALAGWMQSLGLV